MSKGSYITLAQANKALPESTSASFEIVNFEKRTSTRFYSAKYGLVDLKKLSVARAKQLVALKAPFIKEKKSTAVSDKKGSK